VIRNNMQRAMQNDAAVFRTGETLANGVKAIRDINASSPTSRSATARWSGTPT
jgi:succinate dehydrogenase/fumarate reductase flavoprotein subunit